MGESMEAKVARLETNMGHVLTTVADIKTDQKEQNGKLDRLLSIDQQRKGAAKATKALFAVISSGGFLAALGWAWEHFSKQHP
jgi:hypothetical protein